MSAVFLYGALCHAPLRQLVLGVEAEVRAAELADHSLRCEPEAGGAALCPEAGASVRGLLIAAPGAEARARLDWYEAVFGRHRVSGEVAVETETETETETVPAQFHVPDMAEPSTGAGWTFEDWLRADGGLSVAVAADLMALYPGPVPALRDMARRVRGASRLRAEAGAGPVVVRRKAVADDTRVLSRREPYAQFFSVEEIDMTWRRFDGSFGPVVTRAAFISGDAVTVLPYDPLRDRVLLVEQFRAGHFARGDRQPWSLEAIAGRIDPGETPQEAARREAVEEAGLHLEALLPVGSYYPTPGAKSEYLYSYVALTDLPDGSAIIGGEASEAEDIRGHLVGFGAVMDLIASGEIDNAPLILTALWLQRERARLRGLAAPA